MDRVDHRRCLEREVSLRVHLLPLKPRISMSDEEQEERRTANGLPGLTDTTELTVQCAPAPSRSILTGSGCSEESDSMECRDTLNSDVGRNSRAYNQAIRPITKRKERQKQKRKHAPSPKTPPQARSARPV